MGKTWGSKNPATVLFEIIKIKGNENLDIKEAKEQGKWGKRILSQVVIQVSRYETTSKTTAKKKIKL